MSDSLPMFPLNTVLFPGMSVPLYVFEDRYRALVHHLLRVEDPADRVFGSVGIREGYEIGEHGAQWLFRVGCRVQMTEVEAHADGTFELVAVGLDRIELEHLDTSGAYPVGRVTALSEHLVPVPDALARTARDTYEAYREALPELDREPPDAQLPHDPAYLSWALAALAPLSLGQRQALLEAEDADDRLHMVIDVLRGELTTMQVLPSLPATEIARTRWSPN
ncbi:MAG: LON peptidase substrate-binding domain-containing protein [Nocardioides sp.]